MVQALCARAHNISGFGGKLKEIWVMILQREETSIPSAFSAACAGNARFC
jgi:hypothetical protein